METQTKSRNRAPGAGRLRIGDDWNAITIIAFSQSNPLKAVAEFVENSIDAHARHVVITRSKEHGEHYLAIADDGEGIPRNDDGAPDFRYVATHRGHRDFVYASRSRALKLRYLARLFAKELVLKNFPGQSAESLLERMVELSLYTEGNLK